MSSKFSNTEIDVDALQAALQDIVHKIREEEDPAELSFYKQVFKKSVPFFMRSYVAAYLTRGLQVRGGFRRKFTPATLFISIGKNRKVFPRDLVQLIASAGKIQKADIGDIKILDNYAFVEIDEKLAAGVIANMDGITYRGRRLTVNYAKKKGEEGAPGAREGRENRRERTPREPREPRQARELTAVGSETEDDDELVLNRDRAYAEDDYEDDDDEADDDYSDDDQDESDLDSSADPESEKKY